ncbi:reverse transcriptase domain-containing protein [Streptomyces sp. NPDC048385]|uniref:reverse transcriptase domain-containing protein n=1 Tax=unclassified Streptomyces TaxID=2593676 RepID=UPI0034444E02
MTEIDLGRLVTIGRLNADPSWVNRDLYRLMYRPEMYMAAYERIKSKPGNMTKGSDGSTLDGFSERTIQRLIRSMKDESFQFTPARRVFIPKANGKLRPLGIATPVEKVVQEVIRMVLEAIYESPGNETFEDTSHGFRKGRGPHTALKEVKNIWSGTRWFIEGDIKSFFDNIDHDVLISLLRRRISDERFLNLIRKALRAGVLTDLRYEANLAGTPQGSVLSPILANVYLHELDRKMRDITDREERGKTPALNKEYRSLVNRLDRGRRNGTISGAEVKEIKRKMRELPSRSMMDPSYIRVRYIRYADDWLVGVIGPRQLAEKIRSEVGEFLANGLKLELSLGKTHIRHASSEEAFFLGTRISCAGERDSDVVKHAPVEGRRSEKRRRPRGVVRLNAPVSEVVSRLHQKGFCTKEGIALSKRSWTVLDDVDIIARFNAVLNGILNFYSFASNYGELTWVQHILQLSAAKTLSHKHKIGSLRKTFAKYGKHLTASVTGDDGKIRKVSLNLRRRSGADPFNFKTSDGGPTGDISAASWGLRTRSSLGRFCAICGSGHEVQMHHVRHIRKMGDNVTGFTRVMAALNRKQIPACHGCHVKIHNGSYDGMRLADLEWRPV